jgi:hypothetical protein
MQISAKKQAASIKGRPVSDFDNYFRSVLRLYQDLLPWQELEHERLVVFQPIVVVRFTTPLACVAAFTVVAL